MTEALFSSNELNLKKLRLFHPLCVTHNILLTKKPTYLFNKVEKQHRLPTAADNSTLLTTSFY